MACIVSDTVYVVDQGIQLLAWSSALHSVPLTEPTILIYLEEIQTKAKSVLNEPPADPALTPVTRHVLSHVFLLLVTISLISAWQLSALPFFFCLDLQ